MPAQSRGHGTRHEVIEVWRSSPRSRAMKTVDMPAAGHRVVPRDQWLKERIALLAEEKEFTRRRDEMTRKVRDLPWVKVEKPYTFDSPAGTKSLADLFGPHSQLIVYHF